MEPELFIHACLERRWVNFLTALMPTMEGLFLATVLDGHRGLVRIGFHPSVREELHRMLHDLEAALGEAFHVFWEGLDTHASRGDAPF